MNSRCSHCPNTHRQVFADGPTDAKIMLIGEGPGRWEDKTGVPFCGNAGQELDQTYLRSAGLDRGQVYVSNMIQCRCERNGVDVKPGDALRQACAANHLPDEILSVYPEIIVLAGATACSLVPAIDLELGHGFPRRAEIMGWEGWVVPMYHPAAGLHETRYMTPMLEDWDHMGKWMAGRWEVPYESRVAHYELLSGDCGAFGPGIAVDTETDEGDPYSIQWSDRAGRANILLCQDRRSLGTFRERFNSDQPEVVMHNAAYDLEVLDRLGIRVHRFRDTMQELYHLGNLPQGLKQAVYRIFGVRMTSYDEVVTPYSKAVLEAWLAESLAHVSSEMRMLKREQLKTKVRETWKPHPAETVLRRMLSKLDSGYDPWEQPKWDKGVEKPRLIGREWLPEVEAAVGRLPRKSIVHAPLDQQIEYACSDADWTWRLAEWLEQERKRIVEEEWNVAA